METSAKIGAGVVAAGVVALGVTLAQINTQENTPDRAPVLFPPAMPGHVATPVPQQFGEVINPAGLSRFERDGHNVGPVKITYKGRHVGTAYGDGRYLWVRADHILPSMGLGFRFHEKDRKAEVLEPEEAQLVPVKFNGEKIGVGLSQYGAVRMRVHDFATGIKGALSSTDRQIIINGKSYNRVDLWPTPEGEPAYMAIDVLAKKQGITYNFTDGEAVLTK
jgi:hypothetical protein